MLSFNYHVFLCNTGVYFDVLSQSSYIISFKMDLPYKMNEMEKNVKKISQKISRAWEKGIVLSDDTLFFLDSTFGITDLKQVENLFLHGDSPDRGTVLEMILFPEQEIRLDLESLIDLQGLSNRQVSFIVNYLADKRTRFKLIHPGQKTSVLITASLDQIEQFIARLFLDRPVDRDICRALETNCSMKTVMTCRTFLRCRNIRLCNRKSKFLIHFIFKCPQPYREFTDLFELTSLILTDAPEKGDLNTYFLERRRQEKMLIKRICEFEEKHRRYSMEYLMMSRYHIPTESIENVDQRITKMNLIIDDILGIEPPPASPPDPCPADLGRFSKRKGLTRLFDILS